MAQAHTTRPHLHFSREAENRRAISTASWTRYTKALTTFIVVSVVGLRVGGDELMVVTVRFWSFIRAAARVGICTKLRNAPTPASAAHPSYVHLFFNGELNLVL